jgi:MEMO1 family protein
MIRPAAVAGTWYPKTPRALVQDVDAFLQAADEGPAGRVHAILAPHAGLMFSGPVGAWAYKAAARGRYDVVALVGPSHYVGFDGVALWPDGAFASPLGDLPIDASGAAAMLDSPIVQAMPSAHAREHSLEMQLPFLGRLMPGVPIVPMLMGYQHRATIEALGDALSSAFAGRRRLLVASTDLSHFFDAETAARSTRVSRTPWSASARTTCSRLFERIRSTSADATWPAAADRRLPSCARPAPLARPAAVRCGTGTPARSPATTPASSATCGGVRGVRRCWMRSVGARCSTSRAARWHLRRPVRRAERTSSARRARRVRRVRDDQAPR